MMKRMTAAMLAMLMLIGVLSACGSESSEAGHMRDGDGMMQTTAAESEAESTAPSDPYEKLRALDFGGQTIRIDISVDSTEWNTSSKYVMGPEELTGEVISDMVYNRNRDVMEMLNMNVEWTETDLYYNEVEPRIAKLVNAGDDSVDFFINDQYGFILAMQEGYLADVYRRDGSCFDFESEGWYGEFMDQLSVGNTRRYILAGDAFLDVLRGTHVVYFNTAVLEEIAGDRGAIYRDVLDGDWTLDRYIGYYTSAYSDLNGDGQVDKEDRFGTCMHSSWGYLFYFTSDGSCVSFDGDGVPSIDVDVERNSEVAEKAAVIYNDRANIFALYKNATVTSPDIANWLADGRILFSFWLKIAELESATFRELDDLGVAPYPKRSEDQENYVSSAHDIVEEGAFPATVTDGQFAAVSAFVQAITVQSAAELMPAYYQTALQDKYVRDEYSAQMLDIVRSTIASPFENAYKIEMNTIVNKPFAECCLKGSNVYASTAESLREGAEAGLSKLLETLDGLAS